MMPPSFTSLHKTHFNAWGTAMSMVFSVTYYLELRICYNILLLM